MTHWYSAACAGVYKLSHESGTLQGGSSQQMTLRFSPVEVEDMSRVLFCHMPEIQQALAAAAPSIQAPAARPGSAAAAAAVAAAAALKPLTREVTGKVCTGLAWAGKPFTYVVHV